MHSPARLMDHEHRKRPRTLRRVPQSAWSADLLCPLVRVADSPAHLLLRQITGARRELSLTRPVDSAGAGTRNRWDEAHFGKFASYYVNRTFYFDVHPPLGKTLLGAVAAAAGSDGAYTFPSGELYPPDVPYVAMRAVCAGLSATAVPLMFGAIRAFGLSLPASLAATAMVLLGTPAPASPVPPRRRRPR